MEIPCCTVAVEKVPPKGYRSTQEQSAWETGKGFRERGPLVFTLQSGYKSASQRDGEGRFRQRLGGGAGPCLDAQSIGRVAGGTVQEDEWPEGRLQGQVSANFEKGLESEPKVFSFNLGSGSWERCEAEKCSNSTSSVLKRDLACRLKVN